MRAGETETTFDLNFADSALTPFDSPSLYGGRSFKSRLITFEGVDDAVAEASEHQRPRGGVLPLHRVDHHRERSQRPVRVPRLLPRPNQGPG